MAVVQNKHIKDYFGNKYLDSFKPNQMTEQI